MMYALSSILPESIDTLVLFAFAKEPKQKLSPSLTRLEGLERLWTTILADEHHRGELFDAAVIPQPALKIQRLVVVGLGERKACDARAFEHAVTVATTTAINKGAVKLAVALPDALKIPPANLARTLLHGIGVGLYQFLHYKKTSETRLSKLKEVTIMNARGGAKLWSKTIQEQQIIHEMEHNVRTWGNMAPNDCTPTYLAREAKKLRNTTKGLKITVLNKEQIRKHGMGALWGVSKGSAEHPAFIIMEYWGTQKTDQPLVFVGKGITFDSGGISIKPSKGMEEMKFDMAGAAAVIGGVAIIAKLKLPINVVGLAPCSENLPGGEAYKPGDVLESLSGSTIEITNTDAEGRVILADALSWAHRYKPAAIIDLATLTGAALVALAHEGTPLVGNNRRVIEAVKRAAMLTNDRVWELPLWEEFKEETKSDVADVKNTGSGHGGGVITAAVFLQHFVNDVPWAHLDIAGTAWFPHPKPWMGKGATGIGVELLVEVARQWKGTTRSKEQRARSKR